MNLKAAVAVVAMIVAATPAQAVRFVEYTVVARGIAETMDINRDTGRVETVRFYATSRATFSFDRDDTSAFVSYNGTPLFLRSSAGSYWLKGRTSEKYPSEIDISTNDNGGYYSKVPTGTLNMPGALVFNGSNVLVSTREVARGGFISVDTTIENLVPEPATWGLMLLGFGLAGASMRRRRAIAVTYA